MNRNISYLLRERQSRQAVDVTLWISLFPLLLSDACLAFGGLGSFGFGVPQCGATGGLLPSGGRLIRDCWPVAFVVAL